jgi:hypothetical protein
VPFSFIDSTAADHTDGRLTLSLASGSSNNEIAFLGGVRRDAAAGERRVQPSGEALQRRDRVAVDQAEQRPVLG